MGWIIKFIIYEVVYQTMFKDDPNPSDSAPDSSAPEHR